MSAAGDLCLLTLVLFLLSFVVGLIPLKINVGSYYMNLIAVLAAGIVLGTAVIVVLPEGMEMLLHGFHEDDHDDEDDHEDDHDEHEEELNGRFVGMTIIGGIILMMIANRLSPGHGHSHGCVPTTKKTENGVELVVIEGTAGNAGQSQTSEAQPKSSVLKISAITIGLLVHAIFDGVALGVVTFGENERLSAAVFTALIGHKIAEALPLSVILISNGISTWDLVVNMFVFALATPIGALLTYFIVDVGTASTEHAGETVGYCLLFACGTFLGVLMEHIIPGLKTLEPERFSWVQLLVFTVGSLIPLALTHGH